MNIDMNVNTRHRGFTLLETLVGLTLLGVMLILIYSALNVGLRAWDSGEKRVSEASRQRVVQSFLRRDLGQIFPVRWRGIPESRIAFEGAKDDLKFVTMLTLGAAAREGGFQWGHLYVADDETQLGRVLNLAVADLSAPGKPSITAFRSPRAMRTRATSTPPGSRRIRWPPPMRSRSGYRRTG